MSEIERVSPARAKELVDAGWTYVDVRSEPEFQAGHPAGAVNVPVALPGAGGMTPNPDFLRAMRALFAADAKLVIGCQAGGRSMRAAGELVRAGYTSVVEQRAGFGGARDPFGQLTEAGWQAAGLPVDRGAPDGRSWSDIQAKLG